jgi:nicotinamide N-methyltransferase
VAHLPDDQRKRGFHTLILADLLFNHSEHAKLVKSVQDTLRHDGSSCALVFFTPYRPWLIEKDRNFFRLATNAGFTVRQILEEVMPNAMFKDDPGVSFCTVQSTVVDLGDYS